MSDDEKALSLCLRWALANLPADPPTGIEGYTANARLCWEANIEACRLVLGNCTETAEPRELLEPDTRDAVVAAPAGSEERKEQLERTGSPVTSQVCSTCLAPDHPPSVCPWGAP